MSSLISINRRKKVKVLGRYINAQGKELIPEEVYFGVGVFLSVVLPQIIYFSYGGLIPLVTFAAAALAGSTAGVARYYWFPYRVVSCFERGGSLRVPPREDTSRKKAA